MENEKHMAGDYEIKESVHIGGKDIIIGENLNDPDGNYYLVAYCERSDFFERFTDCLVSNNYAETAELFAQRVSKAAKMLCEERDKLPESAEVILTEKDCEPLERQNLKGKVIVIRPDVLYSERQNAARQLYIAIAGNGLSADNFGTGVYCTNLYSKRETRFERYDVLGIIEPEKLPEWAKKGYEEIQKSRKNKERER